MIPGFRLKHLILILVAVAGIWLIFWEPIDWITTQLEWWQSVILGAIIVIVAIKFWKVHPI